MRRLRYLNKKKNRRGPWLLRLLLAVATLTSILISFFALVKLNTSYDELEFDSFEHLLSQSIMSSQSSQNKVVVIRYYDEAAPKPIPGTARSHHLPNAVPPTRIIPRQYAEDKPYHIRQRTNTSKPLSLLRPQREYNWWNHSYETDYRTLYLYNPSIVPLHNTIHDDDDDDARIRISRTNDPDNLSDKDLAELTGGDPNVRYLATYRAYTGCNCFGPDPKREIMKAGEQISYLAVALLDKTLDVIPGTDVLIDLNAGPSRGEYWRQFVEDCRIYVLRGGIYFLCNEELKRMKRRRSMGEELHSIPAGYGTRDDQRIPYVYPNIHGDGLEITMISHNSKIAGGKNLNIFRSLRQSNRTEDDTPSQFNTGPYNYYLQTYPIPHKFEQLDIPNGQENRKVSAKKFLPAQDEQLFPPPFFNTADVHNPILRCKDDNIKNCTDPVLVPFFADSDHGSACCVDITLPGNKKVMVGISHQKLSRRTNFWKMDVRGKYDHFTHDHFVSRFIAYDSSRSFEIVARSGWFCLGYADDNEASRVDGSSLAEKNTNGYARLHLFNETFACPAIHFISGFSDVVGDDSKAIIAYGVNDCHPRMFMVTKESISKILVGKRSGF